MVVKSLHRLTPDKLYPVYKVERIRSSRTKLYHLWVWESERVWGKYYLPIPDFFCENDVIQINKGHIYLEIMYQGVDPHGAPVLIVNKRYSQHDLTNF